jgi:ElaB/YqjD/DUF883 family membrane-anchored ribosome-binding protein
MKWEFATMVAATSHMNGKDRHVRKSLRAVRDDVNTLGNDIAELADAVKLDASSRVRRIRDTGKTYALNTVERMQDQVRERPGIALGAAAGAGLLIGLLLAARR